MVEQIKSELQQAINVIHENIEPQKIYLFGSHAYGSPSKDSDLDLCILTDKLKERKIVAIRKIRHAMVGRVSIPIDILLYTAKEFDERAHVASTLEHIILKDGVQVYGPS